MKHKKLYTFYHCIGSFGAHKH